MPQSEEDELLDALVRAWVEVHKKSATTMVMLRFVADNGPVDTLAITEALARRTRWQLTERGLYRTLQRLSAQGLLSVHKHPGHRTGAQRHLYEISGRGSTYLRRIETARVI